jgi:hypothetical protein
MTQEIAKLSDYWGIRPKIKIAVVPETCWLKGTG